MKIFFTVTIGAALLCIISCEKKEAAPTPPDASKITAPAVPAIGEAAKQATATAEAAQAAATTVVEQSASKAQELIDKAKSLVDANKLTEASTILQQLANLKLTEEQQKLVGSLKTTIQQAMAKQATAEGTKAATDLLGGKK
jgi:hypothetical protein